MRSIVFERNAARQVPGWLFPFLRALAEGVSEEQTWLLSRIPEGQYIRQERGHLPPREVIISGEEQTINCVLKACRAPDGVHICAAEK